ncbi:MAG: aminotransferase class V-fold PLP-dependent enzyme [Ruminococcaceae bacterium]|nr:aminotransferase class V-fold PLP-dependent enzyme [Oscillospiraceae bacterium]
MIYLDSAATSLQKPPEVASAAVRAMKSMSSPGRGAHRYAMDASETVYSCRENLAKLFNCSDPTKIVLTFNATHSLNIAIYSLVQKGTKVLCSGYEHNSVMRPLRALGAKVSFVEAPLFDPEAFLKDAAVKIPQSDVFICTHISNVYGYILPVKELGEICRKNGKPYIVDASQSAGNTDIDFQELNADFLCFPGHKALMGPQGTGVLICKNEAKPLLYGGSGGNSLSHLMPDFLPDMLEAGTHNTPGIAGLNEGIKYVMMRGAAKIGSYEKKIMNIFLESLGEHQDLKVYRSENQDVQSALVSMVCKKCDCEILAEKLAERGVAVRAGLHCAPEAHRRGGSISSGTVRFSFSPYISAAQARTASHELKKILKNL